MIENKFNENNLLFFNGLGGFSEDGKEYIIHLKNGETTPAPWSNIIANPSFGFVVSESGTGYTWHDNAHEFRLTSWSNDPITDALADVIYIQDEQSQHLWSPTLTPIHNDVNYLIRHGFGYSVFESVQDNVYTSLTQYVPKEDSVKLNLLKLQNLGNSSKTLTLTYYMQPVLGEHAEVSAPHINSVLHQGKALVFTNPFSEDYYDNHVYLDASIQDRTISANRSSFFGSGGIKHPDALKKNGLDGIVGSGFDPCGAIQVQVSIKAGASIEIAFQMGSTSHKEAIDPLRLYYQNIDNVKQALDEVKQYWESELSVIQVKTLDTSFDLMINGWLQYQTIASRLYGRSGFYQSGGAFGFRDQLQDVLALTITDPQTAKHQILLHAQHQFEEGDVQHWWHPPYNKGVRTRITDDRLWLVFVTYEYILKTQDYDILNEEVPFLVSPVLGKDEDERYETPSVSNYTASLYEHCRRAIDISLQFGVHNLPLMGGGDWNDGMNLVGIKGKGESVWLAWFLGDVLNKMISFAKHRNDTQIAQHYQQHLEQLQSAIEEHAWDGNWYKRAYYDDGSEMGSSHSDDCKIDSISQSWSIISGLAEGTRQDRAIQSLEEHLIDRKHGIIKLLNPPFDKGKHNPGYIKNYVPGVRENGGQYTHAAVWTIIAFAKRRDKEKALALFDMINPINHSSNYRDLMRYRNEPYVMSADVYSVYPHVGRAGWSWYTGAASWMYKAGVEFILGFNKEGDKLRLDPVIPDQWYSFSMTYRYMDTIYTINVENEVNRNSGKSLLYLDGQLQEDSTISLENDGIVHLIRLVMN